MPTATIIGAGPAGSAAAILLARAGWTIRLVEQHPFPRHKVCGECLSHLGFQVLSRLGLAGHFLAANPIQLTQTHLHASDGSSVEIALPHPMWGLSRYRLDPLLLNEAIKAGAQLLQPCRCESLHGNAQAIIRNLLTNQIKTIESDWILLADGGAALMPTGRPTPTGDLGIKAHFRDVDSPANAIALFGLAGHYIGLAPIEDSLFNAAYAVPESRIRACRGDLDALFQQLLQQKPALSHQFRHAHRASDWLASPLPRFPVQSTWPSGILPIGNAAAALEPIGGEGMGLALRSAELAAHALIQAGPDIHHPSIQALPAAYRRLWSRRRTACRAGAMVVSRPALAAAAVDLLAAVPTLAGPMLRLVGK